MVRLLVDSWPAFKFGCPKKWKYLHYQNNCYIRLDCTIVGRHRHLFSSNIFSSHSFCWWWWVPALYLSWIIWETLNWPQERYFQRLLYGYHVHRFGYSFSIKMKFDVFSGNSRSSSTTVNIYRHNIWLLSHIWSREQSEKYNEINYWRRHNKFFARIYLISHIIWKWFHCRNSNEWRLVKYLRVDRDKVHSHLWCILSILFLFLSNHCSTAGTVATCILDRWTRTTMAIFISGNVRDILTQIMFSILIVNSILDFHSNRNHLLVFMHKSCFNSLVVVQTYTSTWPHAHFTCQRVSIF